MRLKLQGQGRTLDKKSAVGKRNNRRKQSMVIVVIIADFAMALQLERHYRKQSKELLPCPLGHEAAKFHEEQENEANERMRKRCEECDDTKYKTA